MRRTNAYDTHQINLKRNELNNINRIQRRIKIISECLSSAQKSLKSSLNDQLTTSIRNSDKVKSSKILKEPNNLIKIQNILQQIIPMIQQKIQYEADIKITRWQNYAKQKYQELGQQILQQCEQLMMKTQFGNGSRMSMTINDRQSIYFERQSSQNQSNRLSNLIGKQRISIYNSNRMSTNNLNRQSIREQKPFNQSNQILTRATSIKRISFVNNNNINNNNNQDQVGCQLNIEYNTLKQPLFIYEQMKQKNFFIQQLKILRQRQLFQICEAETVTNIDELNIYLSNILGFFVIDLELQKIFKEYDQSNQLLIDSFKNLEKHIKQFFIRIQTDDLLNLKTQMMLFGNAFGKMNCESIQNSINKSIKKQIKINFKYYIKKQYWLRNLAYFVKGKSHPFVVFSVKEYRSMDSFMQQQTYVRILVIISIFVFILQRPLCQGIQSTLVTIIIIVRHIITLLNFQRISLQFTIFPNGTRQYKLDKLGKYIFIHNQKFIEECTQYLDQLPSYDDIILCNLDLLYQEIFDVVKNFIKIQGNSKDALQLCQLSVNMNYLYTSIKFYKKQIENLLQISSNKEFLALNIYNDARLLCEQQIQDKLNEKTFEMMIQLSRVDWEPNHPNKGPNDFFVLLVEIFLKKLDDILDDRGYASRFRWLVYICNIQIYQCIDMENYDRKCKTFQYSGHRKFKFEYNRISQDISYQVLELKLYVFYLQFLNNHKKELMECLKEIRELIQLFLVDKPEDYLDPNKRKTVYSHLNGQKLLLLFPKYNKLKYSKYPVVRQSELKAICKKIQENPSQY